VTVAQLRRQVTALQAELAAHETAKRETEEVPASKGRRSWGWLSQLSAFLTALAAVVALFYTAEGLSQSRDATNRQNALAQSGQITDRFNAAVTNLGSQSMPIRLGGIYALQRIMADSAPDQPSVVQVLAAFIRGLPPGTPPAAQPGLHRWRTSVDAQAAFTVLATRDPRHDGSTALLNLHGANLQGAIVTLTSANLAGMDLTDIDFTDAGLPNANFAGAFLDRANFTGADLEGANFTGAELGGVFFTGTDLHGANLAGTGVTGKNLADANLDGANLAGTGLCNGSDPVDASLGYRCGPTK
jgi:hypothetical protein